MGNTADAEKYLNRSRNWRNQWNPELTSLGFGGFLDARDANGFLGLDPLNCGGCYWSDPLYQGLSWEYSFNAHHDLDHLIDISGGQDMFVRRLQTMFEPDRNPNGDPQFNNTLFDPGNEPSFTTPYLFNWVGRQDLSVEISRRIAQRYYSPTPGGLPGNSDAGAMESWLLWSMIGLYPVTGQTTFLVGSPWFSDLALDLGDGKTLQINANGGNDSAFYVQSLQVNGEDWDRAWVTWDDIFARGGTLDFELGPDPVDWATGPPPPSPAS